MATATVARSAQTSASAAAYDRVFYSSIAIAMGLTVLVGFSRTYFVPLVTGAPRATMSGAAMTPLIHLHGMLFTSWVALFIVQTALVASRRVAMHRRLGAAGAVLAAAMIVVGTFTAISAAKRGSAPPGVDPLAFLAIPLFDMILFATFVTAAVVKRRDRETHKRLMLLAYVSIIVAAIARWPGMVVLGPPVFFSVGFLFVIAAAIYDLISRRRIHSAYLWGGALLALSVPLRLAISGTAAWRAVAGLLTSAV